MAVGAILIGLLIWKGEFLLKSSKFRDFGKSRPFTFNSSENLSLFSVFGYLRARWSKGREESALSAAQKTVADFRRNSPNL